MMINKELMKESMETAFEVWCDLFWHGPGWKDGMRLTSESLAMIAVALFQGALAEDVRNELACRDQRPGKG